MFDSIEQYLIQYLIQYMDEQARIDDQALRNEVRFHRPLGHVSKPNTVSNRFEIIRIYQHALIQQQHKQKKQ